MAQIVVSKGYRLHNEIETTRNDSRFMNEFTFDQVDPSRPWALFLDIDGTLVEFAATPDEVVMPEEVRTTLQRLSEESEGGVAIITGRPIPSADRLFKPVEFPIAGLHGGEFRIADTYELLPVPPLPEGWRQHAKAFAEAHPGVTYEEKRAGFGLHYRDAPELGTATDDAVRTMLLSGNPGYHLLRANMVAEVRPDGIDKGTAIRRFMETAAFEGRHPIFFGDDTTDDDGFRALQQIGGTAVVVGSRRPPEAQYFVKDPKTMRDLLANLKMPV